MNDVADTAGEAFLIPTSLEDVLSKSEDASLQASIDYAEATEWDVEEEVHESSRVLSIPQIAVTPEGIVHLIWVEDGWLWHSARVRDAWGEPRRLFAGSQPSLISDADGNVHMVFVHEFGGRYQVYYSRYQEPLWTLPYEISRTPGISHNPHIVVGQRGVLYVVWEDDTPGFPSIYHAYNPEGHWINAPVPGARGWRPALAVDGEGTLHLVWQSALPNRQGDDVYHAQMQPSGWSLPENISDSPRSDSSLPRVAGGKEGIVHLVWQERYANRSAIGYAFGRYASWLKPLALTKAGTHQSPQIAVAPSGYVHVAWIDRDILAYRSRGPSPDSPWHTPQNIGFIRGNNVSLAMTCDAGGHVHVVWTRQGGDGHVLCYRRRETTMQHKSFVPEVMG